MLDRSLALTPVDSNFVVVKSRVVIALFVTSRYVNSVLYVKSNDAKSVLDTSRDVKAVLLDVFNASVEPVHPDKLSVVKPVNAAKSEKPVIPV